MGDERLREEHDWPEYSDVLIIGAGISGIGAAYRIHEKNPKLSYTMLERRERIGGTWDLFRYPGIRSDSDIFTLSFPCEPWTRPENVADGRRHPRVPDRDRAQARHRRAHPLQHPRAARPTGIRPPTPGRCRPRQDGVPKTYRGRFLFFGTGYYNYDEPYTPGVPRHRELQRRRGAPAVLAGVAGLHRQEGRRDRQRRDRGQPDPGAGREGRPRDDAAALADLHDVDAADQPGGAGDPKGVAAARLAHSVVRLRTTPLSRVDLCAVAARRRRFSRRLDPERQRRRNLPEGYPVDVHFKPRYNPWDQRMCLILDNDLYDAVGDGRAEVVTDHIDHVDADGHRAALR